MNGLVGGPLLARAPAPLNTALLRKSARLSFVYWAGRLAINGTETILLLYENVKHI